MAIHRTGPVEPRVFNVALTGTVPTNTIRTGDSVAAVNSALVPATAFTWTTDLATTQTNYAAAFAGIANGDSVDASTDPRATNLLVTQDGDVEFPLTAAAVAALQVGSFIGHSKAVGNALLQTVESCPTKVRSIGTVVKQVAIGDTTVLVRLNNTTVKR
jgi:hypothetical protein